MDYSMIKGIEAIPEPFGGSSVKRASQAGQGFNDVLKNAVESVNSMQHEAGRLEDAVAKGERVTLVGFGSFEARERKGRYGRNPKTGEKLYIPSARIPAFSVGNFFKNKVNSYFQNSDI